MSKQGGGASRTTLVWSAHGLCPADCLQQAGSAAGGDSASGNGTALGGDFQKSHHNIHRGALPGVLLPAALHDAAHSGWHVRCDRGPPTAGQLAGPQAGVLLPKHLRGRKERRLVNRWASHQGPASSPHLINSSGQASKQAGRGRAAGRRHAPLLRTCALAAAPSSTYVFNSFQPPPLSLPCCGTPPRSAGQRRAHRQQGWPQTGCAAPAAWW